MRGTSEAGAVGSRYCSPRRKREPFPWISRLARAASSAPRPVACSRAGTAAWSFAWLIRIAGWSSLAAFALACQRIEPVGPCVPGVEVGDVIGATVLGIYDETTSYEYDLSVFFGPNSTVGQRMADCDPSRDLVIGERLVVDVIYRDVDSDGQSCDTFDLGLRDSERMTPGAASYGPVGPGPYDFGIALHPLAVVDGCTRSWEGDFLVREGADLYDPAVIGGLPPVLLERTLAATDATCPYSEPSNRCLLAVELARL